MKQIHKDVIASFLQGLAVGLVGISVVYGIFFVVTLFQ